MRTLTPVAVQKVPNEIPLFGPILMHDCPVEDLLLGECVLLSSPESRSHRVACDDSRDLAIFDGLDADEYLLKLLIRVPESSGKEE